MKKLRPYLPLLLALVIALLQLGLRVVRQVVLPTRRRKGNLLSSLFLLFTGLTEHIIGFGEAVARVPRSFAGPEYLGKGWAFCQRYLRVGMLVATWALFILSSLEWAHPGQASTVAGSAARPTATVTASEPVAPQETRVTAVVRVARPVVGFSQTSVCISPPVYISPQPAPSRRWLLLCTFRI